MRMYIGQPNQGVRDHVLRVDYFRIIATQSGEEASFPEVQKTVHGHGKVDNPLDETSHAERLGRVRGEGADRCEPFSEALHNRFPSLLICDGREAAMRSEKEWSGLLQARGPSCVRATK